MKSLFYIRDCVQGDFQIERKVVAQLPQIYISYLKVHLICVFHFVGLALTFMGNKVAHFGKSLLRVST